ncbi:EspA/EspE family type VII secretion system effector [Mycobacterium sp. URHB0044]|uniref:EspA/EspE family type VII secretion system effector n=1 Tax=Mycobacterium sp. URHB0044 TaxID=1380386 RepID=UPI000687EF91|nr:EspA/EspE family type VII secretion system effector [Mycobacterium sp. URHB0044]
MSVLDAFLSTWSNARATFGEGTPETGAQYDQSGQLLEIQTIVESAAPDSTWIGSAAMPYAVANTKQAEVLGKLAALDQRLSARVNLSSQVVDGGRKNLDALRQWVIDAAAAVPPNENRDELLLGIVQTGLGQLSQIVATSNGEATKIAGEIRKLDAEFTALGWESAASEPRSTP